MDCDIRDHTPLHINLYILEESETISNDLTLKGIFLVENFSTNLT